MLRTIAFSTALAFCAASLLPADDSNKNSNTAKPTIASKADASAKAPAHRVSKITGMSVKNDAGRDLGTIKDLVVDMQSGQVRYAAVSYGGFLGLGDKLFAVPWKSFEARRSPDANSYHLVLRGVSENELKNAPGFDQNNWPDFGDQKWQDEVHKFYKVSGTEGDRTAPTDRPATR